MRPNLRLPIEYEESPARDNSSSNENYQNRPANQYPRERRANVYQGNPVHEQDYPHHREERTPVYVQDRPYRSYCRDEAVNEDYPYRSGDRREFMQREEQLPMRYPPRYPMDDNRYRGHTHDQVDRYTSPALVSRPYPYRGMPDYDYTPRLLPPWSNRSSEHSYYRSPSTDAFNNHPQSSVDRYYL
jgi:hypothetical protein